MKKRKTLLLLGGSAQQVVAIETAKRLGYRTVLCDYLPDNPGQSVADKYYPASTTEKDEILKIARNENIDGILAYASDPAAPTAAYVSEMLGLPGNPYRSIEILCDKDKFREFLKANHFCTPKARGYSDISDANTDIRAGVFKFPIIVKPVDSSGSKGVSRIDGPDKVLAALNNAMSFSREKRIILEEFVEKCGYQVAGDGLSVNGKLVFRYFANDHFDPECVNPFVPVAASFPCCLPEAVQDRIHGEIQRLLTLLGMGTCTYNFDIRVDKEGNVYLMEIAPRDGGNYIPQIIRYATGTDLVECSVRAAMGEEINCSHFNSPTGFFAYYAVHSAENGILHKIEISLPVLEKHIIEDHILYHPGDRVRSFTGANAALGILLMRFDDLEQMLGMLEHPEKWITVAVKGCNGD